MPAIAMGPLAAASIAALVGLCVGSFLNVVIYRLPKMLDRGWRAQCAELSGESLPEAPAYNLVVPRSQCPACGHRIGALENIPVVGDILEKATIARWTRTLSTMFAAGVPLVESLDAVAGASGNSVYAAATKRIQTEVSTGASLTNSMSNTKLFPSMVLQMTQIGEESGSLDGMLSKIAEFYEREVDDAVAALSSLLEPIIIVFLGVVIGGLVIAMYLPIFKLGSVIS